jgi:hypothetical protein
VDGGVDLIFAGQRAVDAITRTAPEEFAMDAAVEFQRACVGAVDAERCPVWSIPARSSFTGPTWNSNTVDRESSIAR